jgi:hypothetical protein
MKSLNEKVYKNSKIFNPEILKWIEKEGFTEHKNDAYCWDTKNEWEGLCFFKHGGFSGNSPIHIYIFFVGIGVDIDYGCGGNLSNIFWSFENSSFEDVYDRMVDYVNNKRDL